MDQIVRHSIPNKYDLFDKGTSIMVIDSSGSHLYVQINPDKDNPQWELMDSCSKNTNNLHVKVV
jgi:hypothetical protein